MEFRFTILNKRFVFKFDWRDVRSNTVAGYTNRCIDGKYIVMLDYDNMELDWVINEVKFLQNEFNLSEFYIFRSNTANFHAVCLDKVNFWEYKDILESSSVDPAYKQIPFKYGKKLWTLRVTPKNGKSLKYELKMPVISNVLAREVSTPHMKLLTTLFEIHDFSVDSKRLDNQDQMILAKYEI